MQIRCRAWRRSPGSAGFFADKAAGAKARGEKLERPRTAEEEYADFMKGIAADVKQVHPALWLPEWLRKGWQHVHEISRDKVLPSPVQCRGTSLLLRCKGPGKGKNRGTQWRGDSMGRVD